MARKPADQSVNREDIILAAADVLHRNGYEATTMKDIAAQVNLTAASLYHHFRNKDALLLAVLEGGLQYVYDLLQPVANSGASPYDRLADMVRMHVGSVTQNPAVGAAMVFEIRSLMTFKAPPRSGADNGIDEEEDFLNRRDRFFQLRDKFEALFRNVIKAGMASGDFREVDAAIFAKVMLGAQNWVAVWYKEGGRLAGETIADMIADNFMAALRK